MILGGWPDDRREEEKLVSRIRNALIEHQVGSAGESPQATLRIVQNQDAKLAALIRRPGDGRNKPTGGEK
jgi:hypothetical protein